MRKWHNVIQNSEEWFNLRLGKTTSSNFAKICAHIDKPNFGDPAVRYARQKALEIATGELDTTGRFRSGYMERGSELEVNAVELYEYETMNEVTNGGFSEFGVLGDSPDGLVGQSGCIEVKSVIPAVQWIRIEKGGYDLSYKWQIQGHLYVSDREWCDFISYCPEHVPHKRLYVHRVYRDKEMIEKMIPRLEKFQELIQEKLELITPKNIIA